MDKFKATSVSGKYGVDFWDRPYINMRAKRIRNLKKANSRYCRRKLKQEDRHGKDRIGEQNTTEMPTDN